MICNYGCGREAKFQFKNGKWCCNKNYNSCPNIKKNRSESMKGKKTRACSEKTKKKISKANKGKNSGFGRICSKETRKKISESHKGKTLSKKTKNKMSNSKKLTLKDYKEKHPFLFIVEELKETTNGEIQVHCKNHNCKNSKEKGGWFIPTYNQLYERIRQLENKDGWGGIYLYCSQKCKDECVLFNIKNDPYRGTNKAYTQTELNTLNQLVLKRDNELCYYCGEHATIVHHLRPQKLEPFFALDPDYTRSCCEKCHYKHGHPTGSNHSTGNLAKIVCSVESQKFLNQKLEKK